MMSSESAKTELLASIAAGDLNCLSLHLGVSHAMRGSPRYDAEKEAVILRAVIARLEQLIAFATQTDGGSQ